MNLRPLVMLAVVAALAGCSSGDDTAPLFPQLFKAGKEAVAGRAARRQQDAAPPLTRAVLDTVEGSHIEVTIERREVTGFLQPQFRRTDATPGQIEYWRTQDNVSLSFRNGVLIATRGLGGDLMSSEVRVSPERPGPAGGGERGMHIRTGNLQVARLGLACDLEDLGPETVIVVERAHVTRHLRERCVTEGTQVAGQQLGAGEVVNDYWIEPRTGLMRQSRQWAGPEIGYLGIRRLID